MPNDDDFCLIHGKVLVHDTRSGFDICPQCEREMPADPKRPDAPVTEEHRRIAEQIYDEESRRVTGAATNMDPDRAARIVAQLEARARLAEAKLIRDEFLDSTGWELVSKVDFYALPRTGSEISEALGGQQ